MAEVGTRADCGVPSNRDKHKDLLEFELLQDLNKTSLRVRKFPAIRSPSRPDQGPHAVCIEVARHGRASDNNRVFLPARNAGS